MDCWIWTAVCTTEALFASPYPLLLSKILCVNVIVSICNSNTSPPPDSLSALLIFLFFRPLSLHSLLARSLFHLLCTLSLPSFLLCLCHPLSITLSLSLSHTHTHAQESHHACIKCELASDNWYTLSILVAHYTSLSFRLHFSVYII